VKKSRKSPRAKLTNYRSGSTFWRATLQPLSGKPNLALTNQKHKVSAQKTPTPKGWYFGNPGFHPGVRQQLINPARQARNHSFRINLLAAQPCTPSRVSRILHSSNQKHNASAQKTPTPLGVKLSVAPGFSTRGCQITNSHRAPSKKSFVPHQSFGAQPCNYSRLSRTSHPQIRNTKYQLKKLQPHRGGILVTRVSPKFQPGVRQQLINPARQTTNHSCRIQTFGAQPCTPPRVSRSLALRSQPTSVCHPNLFSKTAFAAFL
jgi:hypothetical protein